MIGPETKLFCIGLSRTGTLSLTKALTMLGVETVHYPEDPETQEQLKKGDFALSILETAQALTDIPIAPYYAQLSDRFPGSKFILTTRPTDSWLLSMEKHFAFYVEHNRTAFGDFVHAAVYGVLHFSRERMAFVKQTHEEGVQRHFASQPGRLLVFNVFEGDGWPQLCDFLGCAVPSEAFPHKNMALAAPAAPPPGIGWNVRWRLRRRRGGE